jgi:hypothetical protein
MVEPNHRPLPQNLHLHQKSARQSAKLPVFLVENLKVYLFFSKKILFFSWFLRSFQVTNAKKILISFLTVIYLKTEGVYILFDHTDSPWMLSSTMFYGALHRNPRSWWITNFQLVYVGARSQIPISSV